MPFEGPSVAVAVPLKAPLVDKIRGGIEDWLGIAVADWVSVAVDDWVDEVVVNRVRVAVIDFVGELLKVASIDVGVDGIPEELESGLKRRQPSRNS